MVLRSSISSTRRFFHKTVESFKSLFSNGYQKLPKTPNTTTSINPRPDLTFYNKTHNPNIIISSSPPPSLHQRFHAKPRRSPVTPEKNNTPNQKQRKTEHEQKLCSKPKIQLVRQKLKELETMIGGVMSETDHVSDVQEFLHYYSRLRCPAYLDIVEQFFMEMYSEFFVPQLEPPRPAVAGPSRRYKH